jgi:hypothetical protein
MYVSLYQEINYHDLCYVLTHLEDLVELGLVQELGVPRLHALQLHRHLLPVRDVNT